MYNYSTDETVVFYIRNTGYIIIVKNIRLYSTKPKLQKHFIYTIYGYNITVGLYIISPGLDFTHKNNRGVIQVHMVTCVTVCDVTNWFASLSDFL